MTFDRQDDLARYVRGSLTRHIQCAETPIAAIDPVRRRQPRADGGWSIDQTLAHLARMDEAYMGTIRRACKDGWGSTGGIADRGDSSGSSDEGRDAPSFAWKPTIAGRVLRWGITGSLPIKTPATFLPERLETTGDVLHAFQSSHRDLLDLMERLKNRRWTGILFSSPATPLLRLNAGDVFLMLAEHGDHHLEHLHE
ncbi:MAG: DinB family protein [Rhodothermales bacterium]